jgi:BlaI family penicillinase repressor
MSKIPPITDAEWSIMKVLWDHPDQWLAAGDIVEPVTRQRAIHHRTARTLLARLVKKQAVESRPASTDGVSGSGGAGGGGGGGNLYRAKVQKDAAVRQQSRSFLSRVFDGNAAPALVHLLKESQLSPEDLKELRALLHKKEKP